MNPNHNLVMIIVEPVISHNELVGNNEIQRLSRSRAGAISTGYFIFIGQTAVQVWRVEIRYKNNEEQEPTTKN